MLLIVIVSPTFILILSLSPETEPFLSVPALNVYAPEPLLVACTVYATGVVASSFITDFEFPFNVYYSQRNGSQDGSVFSDDPLGSYQLSVLKGALVSLAYNFKFQ